MSDRSWLQTVTVVVVLVLLIPITATVVLGFESFYHGDTRAGSDYASFASGMASIVLVVITGFYAVQTKSQVDSAEKSRKQRKYQRELDKYNKKQSLRRALKEEIDRTADVGGKQSAGLISGMESIVPRNVYNENADSIGLLSDKEVERVVKYYNTASTIESISHNHRNSEDDYTDVIGNMVELLRREQQTAVDQLEEAIEESEPPTDPLDSTES